MSRYYFRIVMISMDRLGMTKLEEDGYIPLMRIRTWHRAPWLDSVVALHHRWTVKS